VRLTEAAENLKKRAMFSVQMGKENEAVELLVQKKKLTKALENIKERIELLDKLSTKISEVMTCSFIIIRLMLFLFLKLIYLDIFFNSCKSRMMPCRVILKQFHTVVAILLIASSIPFTIFSFTYVI
jgi:formate-dependent nitrite reductase membrane component NrfD